MSSVLFLFFFYFNFFRCLFVCFLFFCFCLFLSLFVCLLGFFSLDFIFILFIFFQCFFLSVLCRVYPTLPMSLDFPFCMLILLSDLFATMGFSINYL